LPPSPRYRFGDFVLSPRRRVLLRSGREQPLIPRYFDLLLFLVEHRHEAVHRQQIFEAVWGDVAVSDSALSQAVRTVRRLLGDDSREPRFVRTVSRHGYQFVFVDVVEEDDTTEIAAAAVAPAPAAEGNVANVRATAVEAPAWTDAASSFAPLLQRLRTPATTDADREDQRDAAERLHELGTAEALRQLGTGRGSVFARALLRDTRWETPRAGDVPILGAPHALAIAIELLRLRLVRAARLVASRWARAALGSGVAGLVGGALGGVLLVNAPASPAPASVIPVLAAIGFGCGAVAGAGIGAGLAIADATMRSRRLLAATIGGALGGAAVGFAIELLGRWTLEVLVGVSAPVGGGIEGLSIGAAAGLGYGVVTKGQTGGLPAPRGAARVRVAAVTAATCAITALLLSLGGRALVGGTIHGIAQAAAGAEAMLTPLGRLIGEPGFGPVTAAFIAMAEGATFGAGLAIGLTSRPKHR
jgi:DNA-binding winged helix-turn-helix (wHTH) protein